MTDQVNERPLSSIIDGNPKVASSIATNPKSPTTSTLEIAHDPEQPIHPSDLDDGSTVASTAPASLFDNEVRPQ